MLLFVFGFELVDYLVDVWMSWVEEIVFDYGGCVVLLMIEVGYFEGVVGVWC